VPELMRHVSESGGIAEAMFSDDNRHRYLLTRSGPIIPGLGPQGFPLFLMLNPSVATHEVSDPTVTRCAGFAKRLGYRSFRVCNLFSLRATDPRELLRVETPEGDPANIDTIISEAERAEIVICAWGAHGALRHRQGDVARVLRLHGLQSKLRCFGKNKDGSPKHPLYLANDTELQPYLEGIAND
jgi:hypothetical protein